MINITKVISSELDSLARRVVKFLRLGKGDVQTALNAAPFGVDSNAVPNMRAIYMKTSVKGKTVIIGYINANLVAEIGETRIFSTDSDGNLAIEFRLKPDGTAELGGSVDNLMRFAATNTQMQGLVTQLQAELVKIATGIVGAGGAYTPGTLTLDLSTAKIDQLKTS